VVAIWVANLGGGWGRGGMEWLEAVKHAIIQLHVSRANIISIALLAHPS